MLKMRVQLCILEWSSTLWERGIIIFPVSQSFNVRGGANREQSSSGFCIDS